MAEGRASAGVWRRTARAVFCLTVVMVAAWWVDVWFFIPANHPDEVAVAGVAAAVCWMSSVMALAVTIGCAMSQHAMAGALGGILFRTGGPLAAMAAGSLIPWLERNGFAGQVVVFFLVSLTAETILAVAVAKRTWNIRLWR
jgi:hypothetical protein